MSDADARMWAMLTHLSALPGSVVLIGSVVAPLIIWQIQKEQKLLMWITTAKKR